MSSYPMSNDPMSNDPMSTDPTSFDVQPPARPTVVTAAGYLLYGVACLLILNMITSLVTLSTVTSAVEAANPTDESTARTAITVTIVVMAVLDLLLVVLFAVLAFFDLKGRNGMRITTWVIGGIGVLCLSCGAIGSTTGSAFDTNNGQTQGVSVNMDDVLPGWARAAEIIFSVTGVVVLILVIIMLALPSSNAFFRKPQRLVAYPGGYMPVHPYMPGYPPPGYPPVAGDPAYPTGPGYPPTGYPPTGYPPTGYPPTGYPPTGYPQPGYPQSGYPQPGYPQPGYPQGPAHPPVSPAPPTTLDGPFTPPS